MADRVSSGERNAALDIFAGSSSAVAAVQGVFGPAGAAVGAAKVGAAMAGATAGAASGSWAFDREQIDAVIRQWEDLRDDLEQDRQSINSMIRNAVPPSSDDPSGQFVKSILDGLRSLDESNSSMAEYVQDFLDKLYKARNVISQTETDNTDPFRSATSPSDKSL
ncbi:hypothetical protein FHU38_001108 [Saccharomonospora amisosensis]|uniref:Uncharacterized protein n=1 Tax=Saccharomonospora amisosensis TaxID=1128677 RepID=A0A7X5ZPI6_9PSEU|nr:hypothetical protein [Saccharomonospora amisosensis]NIJ10764.1 hypothetical protein [Saccharomonospora amisosensis]